MSSATTSRRRARIALVVDAPHWAFDGMARAITPTLEQHFDVERLYLSDYAPAWAATPTPGTALELFHELFCGAYDLVHFFSRGFAQQVFDPVIRLDPAMRDPQALVDRVFRTPITLNLHDHQLLDDARDRERTRMLLSVTAAGYLVSSASLREAIATLADFPPPVAVIHDGVDTSTFQAAPAGRLAETHRPLVVGWAGNSNWGIHVGYVDHKGLRGVIRPALDMARAAGIPIEARLHDRADRWLPRAQLVDLLQGLDVYACASLHEGSASTVLEALACGIPVVSTRVGILPEVVGPLQSQLLVARTPEAFAEAIARLAADPALRVAVGHENRQLAEQLTWERCGQQWAAFFAQALVAADTRTGAMSPAAVWERIKAWSARVAAVLAESDTP